ncbi:Cullin repeat-like-containing domain protein, partial [Immersiella caudata]
AIVKAINIERNGGIIDHRVIKIVLGPTVSLRYDESNLYVRTPDFYQHYFKQPFLRATIRFYQDESKQFLSDYGVIQYMKKAETRLDEEEERIRTYLPAAITIPLETATKETLIAWHAHILRAQFQDLLDNEYEEDMARMFNLLSRIPNGLDPLRREFEARLRKAGLSGVFNADSRLEKLKPRIFNGAI